MSESIDTGTWNLLDEAGRGVARPPAVGVDQFPDTRWTWIRRASGSDSQEAFGNLCRAYWYPVYCFLRRSGASATDAGDITQDFFEYLLTSDKLTKVEPREDCRFRTWLRTQAKRYFFNYLRKTKAVKLGGGAPHIAIDSVTAERKLARELMHTLTPERLFDRCWARTVTERALQALLQKDLELADVELLRQAIDELSGTAERSRRASDAGSAPVPKAERVRKSKRKSGLLGEYRKYLRREIHGTVGKSELIDREICLLLDVLPCR